MSYGLMGLWVISSPRQSNVGFATVITRLQEDPKCQRLPFSSFLLLPFQRITRIKILTEVDNPTCAVHSRKSRPFIVECCCNTCRLCDWQNAASHLEVKPERLNIHKSKTQTACRSDWVDVFTAILFLLMVCSISTCSMQFSAKVCTPLWFYMENRNV